MSEGQRSGERLKVVVQGAASLADVPGLEQVADAVDLTFATTLPELTAALPGTDVLFGWDFRAGDVEKAWPCADALRWIQWGGAGVDSLMFPALAQSDVVLTNAGGLFDKPMAEYALGLILMHAKDFRESIALQSRSEWRYRLNTRVAGQHAVVIGVGNIGREIGRMLRLAGLKVTGVGRSARSGDPDFGDVRAVHELASVLPDADYVVLIAPLTAENPGLFGAAQFAAMKPSAYFINLARGELLDERALVDALDSGKLAGAALDVFRTEPLPVDSDLWQREDVFISAHTSGDFIGYHAELVDIFLENLARFNRGDALANVVDKRLGFVPSPTG